MIVAKPDRMLPEKLEWARVTFFAMLFVNIDMAEGFATPCITTASETSQLLSVRAVSEDVITAVTG